MCPGIQSLGVVELVFFNTTLKEVLQPYYADKGTHCSEKLSSSLHVSQQKITESGFKLGSPDSNAHSLLGDLN